MEECNCNHDSETRENHLFPQNHRLKNLVSSVGKIIEQLILESLLDESEGNYDVPKDQYGFRYNYSTEQ